MKTLEISSAICAGCARAANILHTLAVLWEQEVAGSNPAAPISIKSKSRSDGAETSWDASLFLGPVGPSRWSGQPLRSRVLRLIIDIAASPVAHYGPVEVLRPPVGRPPEDETADHQQRWMHFVLEVASYDRISPVITRLTVQCDSWNAPSVAKKWRVLRRCAHDVRAFLAAGPLPEEVASPYRSQCS